MRTCLGSFMEEHGVEETKRLLEGVANRGSNRIASAPTLVKRAPLLETPRSSVKRIVYFPSSTFVWSFVISVEPIQHREIKLPVVMSAVPRFQLRR